LIGGPLIVNVALTGMVPTKADNAAVPITAAEIADDAERCVGAGASIVHLHARDEDGRPTWRPDAYRRVISAVLERVPDVIVCVSTSGRIFSEFDKRAAVLDLEGDQKPELASLTLGSLNFPRQASVNDPQTITALAERMSDRGIVPELEVFDLGMVDYAKYLLDRGVLRRPFYFNVLLGSLGTLSATPFHLATVVQSLPAGAVWSGAGIGRFQFPINSMAVTMGGHVRVGLEDNLWLDADKTRPATNVELVRRIVRLADAAERPVATSAETRALIGLPSRAAVPAAR
jgi:3-keto-5-aminohexanoate cleavage enzyme